LLTLIANIIGIANDYIGKLFVFRQ